MNIDDKKINDILTRYNYLKTEDLHINDDDGFIETRRKDMAFGKVMGYEEVLKSLDILE